MGPPDRFKIESLAARVLKLAERSPGARSVEQELEAGDGGTGLELAAAGIELHVVRKLPRHLVVREFGAHGDPDLPLSAVPGGR
jgi:hypothetical protein